MEIRKAVAEALLARACESERDDLLNAAARVERGKAVLCDGAVSDVARRVAQDAVGMSLGSHLAAYNAVRAVIEGERA